MKGQKTDLDEQLDALLKQTTKTKKERQEKIEELEELEQIKGSVPIGADVIIKNRVYTRIF